MRRDPTEFRQRFNKWKAGKLVYDKGRPITDDEYVGIMENVASENNPKWNEFRRNNGDPELSEDEELRRILNDNSYDYRGYYNKYPNSRANADTHWTDEFKTVYHPTFSVLSKYSGKKSQYNPEGVLGGQWLSNEVYVPAWGLKLPTQKLKLPKFRGGAEGEIELDEYDFAPQLMNEVIVTPQKNIIDYGQNVNMIPIDRTKQQRQRFMSEFNRKRNAASSSLANLGILAASLNPLAGTIIGGVFGAQAMKDIYENGFNRDNSLQLALSLPIFGRGAFKAFNKTAELTGRYAPTTVAGKWSRAYTLSRAIGQGDPKLGLNVDLTPKVRTKIGDVEVNDPNILYHTDWGDGAGAMSKMIEAHNGVAHEGPVIRGGWLFPGSPYMEGQKGYSWWNLGKPWNSPADGMRMTTAHKDHPFIFLIRGYSEPVGQWNGKSGFVTKNEYASSLPIYVGGHTYVFDSNYGWKKVLVDNQPVGLQSTMANTAPDFSYRTSSNLPFDTENVFKKMRALAYDKMITGAKLEDYEKKLIHPSHFVTERPIPEQSLKILLNSTLPRMLEMRPWMNKEDLIREFNRYNKGTYLEVPKGVYDIVYPGRGKSIKGLYSYETDVISSLEGENAGWVMPHEIRHRVDNHIPLVLEEERILGEGYGKDFETSVRSRQGWEDYEAAGDDAITTNADARIELLGEYHAANSPHHLQNKIIEKASKQKIVESVRNANGYGRDFIAYLEENGLLTDERIEALRRCMIKLGAMGIPIAITTQQRNNTVE